jgi:GH43 family beta-xylosidase
MKRYAAFFLSATLLACSSTTAPIAGPTPEQSTPINTQAVATNFGGPLVFKGAADPYMTYYSGNYYLMYTTAAENDIRVRIASSVAGLWKASETVLYNPTNDPSDRNSKIWAPEMHRLNGPNGYRWYIYYTAGEIPTYDKQRMHVLESNSDSPTAGYTYKGRLNNSDNYWGIDPTPFTISNQLYIAWSGSDMTTDPTETRIYLSKASNPWTLTGSRTLLSTPTNAWEKVGRGVNEGPAILIKNNKVFMTYSGSGCWTDDYALGMLSASSSANLLSASSWTKSSGAVFSKSVANGVYGPGHNGFFSSPNGETWMVYHANSKTGTELSNACGDFRTARIKKINFDSNGNPTFGSPDAYATTFARPSGDNGFNFDAPTAGNTYRLINEQGARCLDVDGGADANKANVQLWECNGLNPQNWVLRDAGNGYFYLASKVNSGATRCLDVDGANSAPGTNVQIWECNTNNAQKWKFVDVGAGYYRLESGLGNSLALDNFGGGVTNKSNVGTYTINNNPAQSWRLEKR